MTDVEKLEELLHKVRKVVDFCCGAEAWAKVEHPEWISAAQRARKNRVFKKYWNRILREYSKHLEEQYGK